MALNLLESKLANLSFIPLVAGASQAVLDHHQINIPLVTAKNSLPLTIASSGIFGMCKGVDYAKELKHPEQGIPGFYAVTFAVGSAVLYGMGYYGTRFVLNRLS